MEEKIKKINDIDEVWDDLEVMWYDFCTYCGSTKREVLNFITFDNCYLTCCSKCGKISGLALENEEIKARGENWLNEKINRVIYQEK